MGTSGQRARWVVLLLVVGTSSPGRTAPDPIAGLLNKHGIRAISPPSQAVDFTLPDLRGSQRSLSASKGRWVLLTFFATWCGPCAVEMPYLERLHQARQTAGFDIIGVAIEPGRDKIAAFTKKKGVTFPVLIDAPGKVAAIYRANSVPISYLIDPAGRLTGVIRGARDWSKATGLVDDVLAAVPPDAGVASVYQGTQDPVDLPSDLVPPEGEVEVATAEPRAGELATLYIRIKWAGDFQDYLLLPPQVHLPEGVEHVRTSAQTSSELGRAVVTYRVDLMPRESGSYALDPVELRYTPRFESEPQAQRLSGPTISVAEPTLLGLSAWGWAGIGGGLVAAIVFVALLVAWQKRLGRVGEEPDAQAAKHARLAEHLAAARRARVDGDSAAFFTHLQPFEDVLEEPGFADLCERVRYGGHRPSPQQLDYMLRRAERRVAELAPDPAAAHKRGLKLKPEEN